MTMIIGKASAGRGAVTRKDFIAVMLVGLHTGVSFWANAPVTLGKTAAYGRNDLR